MKQSYLWSKPFITLILLNAISLAGFSFIWPLTTLYVTHVLGQSMSIAGIVLSLEAAAGMAGNFIGGSLYDSRDGKWLITIASVLVAVASLFLVVWNSWWGFLFNYFIINFCIGSLITIVYAAVSKVCAKGDRRAYNIIYISRNVGVSVGVFVGGMVASSSFMYAFLLNGILFAILPLIVWFGFSNTPHQQMDRATSSSKSLPTMNLAHRHKFMFVMLGIGVLLTMISYMQWQSTISVYMQSLGDPLALYSLLWTINGILAIILQPLSNFFIRFISSERVQLIVGESIFVLSFLVLIVFPAYWGFVASMALATVAEVMVWPVIPALTASLAPDNKAGFYQGMMNTFNSAGRLVGPVTGATIYQYLGANAMLCVMAVSYILAMGCFAFCRPQWGNTKVETETVLFN